MNARQLQPCDVAINVSVRTNKSSGQWQPDERWKEVQTCPEKLKMLTKRLKGTSSSSVVSEQLKNSVCNIKFKRKQKSQRLQRAPTLNETSPHWDRQGVECGVWKSSWLQDCMSWVEWPEEAKWRPIGRSESGSLVARRCYLNLSPKRLQVSPI